MGDTENKIPLRSEVAVENTWALEDLYATDDDWKADMERLKSMLQQASGYQGRLSQSSAQLLAFLKLQDDINVVLTDFANYSFRKADEDTRNTTYQGFKSQTNSLIVSLSSALSFAEPEILSIPDETLEQFYQEQAELSVYKRYIHDIRRKKAHILSNAEEKIMAAAGEMAQAPDEIYGLLNNADMTFPDITDSNGKQLHVTHGSFIPLLQNSDVKVRKAAFESLYSSYDSLKNTSAALLAAQMKQLQFNADMRHYDSALAAALDNNNVDTAVYYNLIEAVHENMDAMYKYVRLRKKLLGVEELHMYDLYVPVIEQDHSEIPFEQAKKTVLEGLAPMGEEYLHLLREGFDHGWIDVYENQGKRSGAYSWGAYGTHPYVLLNYQGTLHDVFTLAHEMGHALHSWYSDEHQPYIYAGYRIFVAEVASTCNEALLIHYLMEQSKKAGDRKKTMYLMNYFLEQFRTTLFRQTMFAEFEKITHGLQEQGETLTADRLCEIYYDLNKLYFGEEICVDQEIAMEWARIPHFYTPFYVYQYATGFSAAIALSKQILEQGAPAVERYKKFLKGGSSMYPLELLKMAGVDMEQKAPVQDALAVFAQYLDEMERLADHDTV